MNEEEIIWTPWTTVGAVDAAPTERRTGTWTDADGRTHLTVQERRPAGAGYTVVSQDAA